MRRSDTGAAAGASGWGSNFAAVLADDVPCVAAMALLVGQIVNNKLPPTIRELLNTCLLVSLVKPGNGDGRRPVAMGDMFYRMAARFALSLVMDSAQRALRPHQFVWVWRTAVHRWCSLCSTCCLCHLHPPHLTPSLPTSLHSHGRGRSRSLRTPPRALLPASVSTWRTPSTPSTVRHCCALYTPTRSWRSAGVWWRSAMASRVSCSCRVEVE